MLLPRESLIEFRVYKLKTFAEVWISKNYLDKPISFWDEYLYSSIIDEGVNVDYYKNFLADRYGGEGILRHGGSGRCGALNSFQMKGVGPTPLIGNYLFGNYHDGRYELRDALQEIFYDNILNRLNRAGQPFCHALFKRDQVNFDKSQEVILIKDFPYRIAHFIAASYFKPCELFNGVSDAERTKVAVQNLHEISASVFSLKFDTIDDLIKTVARIHGENLAMLRILMVLHGSISPSNLTINGQFIDLSCTVFWSKRLGNYSRYLSFHYDEVMKTKKSLSEFEFAVRKYLQKNISCDYLVDKTFDTSYIDALMSFTNSNFSKYEKSQGNLFHEYFTEDQKQNFDLDMKSSTFKVFHQLRQIIEEIRNYAANFHATPSNFSNLDESIDALKSLLNIGNGIKDER